MVEHSDGAGNDTIAPGCFILGTDANPNAVGRHFVDAFETVPFAEDAAYLDEIDALVERYEIDVVLPQTTRETMVLAGHPKAAVSERAKEANDKVFLLDESDQEDLNTPDWSVSSGWDFASMCKVLGYPSNPIVVKPPVSNGSRGVRVLTPDPITTDEYLNERPGNPQISLERFLEIVKDDMPRLLVMEYLPGREWTVDCFRGERMFVAVPRIRHAIRSGITFETEVVRHPELEDQCRRLAEALDLKYAFGFQFKEDADGVPNILECNPRIQGTMVASLFAGVNIPWLAVRERSGDLPDGVPEIKPARFQRFWGGVGTNGTDRVEVI